jgi:hypothetical protein
MAPETRQKKRRLSLFSTIRIRNGGATTSHITLSNTPIDAADSSSDTEDENDEETAQYYLNKMSDDTDRETTTVFGKDVDVWTSFGGTVYAEVTDSVRRKMREEELWGENARDKVEEGGLKRKIAAEKQEDEGGLEKDVEQKKDIPTQSPMTPYPSRDPAATQFHHGSAGIDPLGALNRPIKPIPKRRLPSSTISPHITSSAMRVGIEGASPSLHNLPPGTLGLHHDTKGHSQMMPPPPNLPRPGAPPTPPSPRNHLVPPVRPNRIVSGSFGSFDGSGQGRFDERKYRLGPKEDRKALDQGEKKLDVFKGKPWLRR